jgi:hypothetical protein
MDKRSVVFGVKEVFCMIELLLLYRARIVAMALIRIGRMHFWVRASSVLVYHLEECDAWRW